MWDIDYNALGQPTQYSHPNGMTTVYSYDTRNSMTKIQHKDGAAVKESFTYALDDNGNIDKTTHEDGSLWDYLYDGRYRLTKATRSNAASPNDTIKAVYTYAYNDDDNLITKVTAFEENFNDGNGTGWTTTGTWTFSGFEARTDTDATADTMYRTLTGKQRLSPFSSI